MATKIIPKKSSVVDKVPLAADLEVGEIAINLADKKIYSKNSANTVVEIGGSASGGSSVNGTAIRQSFTATANQTTFAIAGGYDAPFADVYLNGVKLVNGIDVDVTSGTNVVLTTGASAGDSVSVIAYGSFEVADTYTQAQIDDLVNAPLLSALQTDVGTLQTDVDNLETDKVNKSGDTMTGALALPANGLTVGTDQFVTSGGNVGIGPNTNFSAKINLPPSDYGESINYYSSPTESNRSGVGKYSNEIRNYVPSEDFFSWRTGGPNGTERMRIDSAGRVTMPFQPLFSASFNVGGPVAYVTGGRILNFTDTDINVGNNYDGTNKFTAPIAGRYMFNVNRALNTIGGSKTIRHPSMNLLVNGVSVHGVNTGVSSGSDVASNGYTHFSVHMTAVVALQAGDFVQVTFSYSNSPSTLYEYGNNYFSGVLIG